MADASGDPGNQQKSDLYDYIIVGTGAGGAPLAARLAQRGKRVLVLEAGSNHGTLPAAHPANEVTRVPVLHTVSTEHPDLAWRFFVEHYDSNGNGEPANGIPKDPKWYSPNAHNPEVPQQNGIFYPRASSVGGCTIHNAMITLAGPDSDWDDLAQFVNDPTWRGEQMRAYFQRLERNDYLPPPEASQQTYFRQTCRYVTNCLWWLFGFTPDTGGRHGFGGWLHTSVADLSLGLGDPQLIVMLKAALRQSKAAGLDRAWSLVSTFLKGRIRQSLDPNHSVRQRTSPEGVVQIPVAIYGKSTNAVQDAATPYAQLGRRSSPRELLMDALRNHPNHLEIRTECLVTEVILEKESDDPAVPPRAVGVRYQHGTKLYRASIDPAQADGDVREVRVSLGGEVILCGGTFNTPQILMLSGIGPKTADGKIGVDASTVGRTAETYWSSSVECKVASPGVGRNLQDRYEVSVVCEMKKDFDILRDAPLTLPVNPSEPDRYLREWRDRGTGLYASNGGVLGILKRSRPELAQPDLFIFGVPLEFRGYAVGYSQARAHNLFTWIILKSHTHNDEGIVRLRSGDPRDTPLINFHSFRTRTSPQDSESDADVLALAEGVRFARGIIKRAGKVVKGETHPGPQVAPFDNTAKINEWIRRDAWGHHACGTCRMGADADPNAVLDSRFRVRGVSGLRVVDASIFPKIPGYFIVTNIYMASEKAADVILEDARKNVSIDSNVYPNELFDLEIDAIKERRGRLPDSRKQPVVHEPIPGAKQGAPQRCWHESVTGLALSGGGIRSATLCLGVLQSLARGQLLRRMDFLSTVSGGGYIGSFLGRMYDRMRSSGPHNPGAFPNVHPAVQVEQTLNDNRSAPLNWLRRHGNYLAPRGAGDGRTNFAVFVRNLISVHLIVGLALFSLFAVVNGVRHTALDPLMATVGLAFDCSDLPIGHLVSSWLGPFFSPWFIIVEMLILFLVIPRIAAYWLVSQDRHEAFKPVPLTLLLAISGGLLLLGVTDGLKLELIFSGLSLLTSIIQVEVAWQDGTNQERATGTGGVETQRLRTRNFLTYELGLALSLTGAALVFVLIDTLGHGLYEWKVAKNVTYTKAFAGLIASIMVVMPAARFLTSLLSQQDSQRPSALVRVLKRNMVACAMAAALFTLPLVFYSFAAHAAFSDGVTPEFGWSVTAVAVLLTCAFAFPSAVSFVNQSSLSQTYSARLARAYLGASNPLRHRPDGANVTEVMPGDDVPSIRNYQPHMASGPFHLMSLTLNESVDPDSLGVKRDRQGLILSVSSLGMTVGETWHSKWVTSGTQQDSVKHRAPARLEPLGAQPGSPHPLVDLQGQPADAAEMLSLRTWIGLSGAAIDPGRGRSSTLGNSLLMGLVNMRTGYWWDSGISHAARRGFPDLTFSRRLLYLVPRFFATQSLLIYEWLSRFPGPWARFWHLSDGGFFENLGAYELIRRRVRRIVIVDAGADPEYTFEDLAEMIRKVRIDFDATVEPLTAAEITALKTSQIPGTVAGALGTLSELVPATAVGADPGKSPCHATLLRVTYADDPEKTQSSLILYVKATVSGDESVDVGNYHRAQPDFPHEPTADQFFDEPQWESYRKLGEHIGTALGLDNVATRDWFWKIPL